MYVNVAQSLGMVFIIYKDHKVNNKMNLLIGRFSKISKSIKTKTLSFCRGCTSTQKSRHTYFLWTTKIQQMKRKRTHKPWESRKWHLPFITTLQNPFLFHSIFHLPQTTSDPSRLFFIIHFTNWPLLYITLQALVHSHTPIIFTTYIHTYFPRLPATISIILYHIETFSQYLFYIYILL